MSECNRNNCLYFGTILFMIPLIIFSFRILFTKTDISNLKNILAYFGDDSSKCYKLTYSFIYESKLDKNYLSLESYLGSLNTPCIVLIITYFIRIMFSACFGNTFASTGIDGGNGMFIVYFCLPFSLIALIPISICISYFNLENYELFMNYYKLCSNYYGDEFKNSLNNIMNIQKLTKNIKYSVYFEMAYHFLVFYLIFAQK